MPKTLSRRVRKPVRAGKTRTVRQAPKDEAALPPFPSPDAAGRVNALRWIRASIARELIRARHDAGLTQQKLAELAHVRQETISRIESARHTATPRVLNKLMRALSKVQPSMQRRKASA